MIPAVKICGCTREADVILCEELGVEYIGFIFVGGSPRRIAVERVKELRSCVKVAKTVGVFVDEDVETVRHIARSLALDFVQLHGSESEAYIRELGLPCIRAFRSVPLTDILDAFSCEGVRVMLDGKGNGTRADWDSISQLPFDIRSQLFLAGGLTSGNVAEAIAKIQPFAVDAASGVESEPGVKDHGKLKAFIQAVRSCPHA